MPCDVLAAIKLCKETHVEFNSLHSHPLISHLLQCITSPPLASALREQAFAALHGQSCDLPVCTLRSIHLCASALEASLLLSVDSSPSLPTALAALRLLDIAEMVGGPHPLLGSLRAEAAAAAAAHASEAAALPSLPPAALAGAVAAAEGSLSGRPLATLTLPSAAHFLAAAFHPALPCRIRGAIAHWPALAPPAPGAQDRRWEHLAYLQRAAGLRTVPLEQGSSSSSGYLAPSFSLQLCRLEEFLQGVLAPSVAAFLAGQAPSSSSSSTGSSSPPYLAQHALFDACPALAADIAEPDYIAAAQAVAPGAAEEGSPASAKAWLGPTGTYTPLHFDATHNLLAQVVGAKRVRLLPPLATPFLYPAPPPLGNTSTVPREALCGLGGGSSSSSSSSSSDSAALPLLRECPHAMLETVLSPGDMLFIPRGYWHDVEALSPSFSVSFWWH